MNKPTREAVLDPGYPIQVTSGCELDHLSSWIEHLVKKEIPYVIKPMKNNKFSLWRKMTEEEKQECRDGKWNVHEGGFKCLETEITSRKKLEPFHE